MQTVALFSEIDGCQAEIATLHQRIVDLEQRIETLQADNERLRIAEATLAESWRFVTQIANSIPVILYVYDLVEQRNVYSNHQITNILGYSVDDIQAMGKEFLPALLHPDDHSRYAMHRVAQQQTQDDALSTIEYRIRHADGTWRWLFSREVNFARARDGQVQQILGVAYDITDQKQNEAQLHMFKALIEHTSDLIAIASAEGIITYANPAYCQMFRGDTTIIGSSLLDLHPELAEDLIGLMHLVDQGGWSGEMVHRHPDGSLFPGHVNISAFRDQQGRLQGIAGIFRDISDLVRIEQALCESQMLLQAVIDNAPLVIVVKDRQGRYLLANQRAAANLHLAPEQMIGMSEYDLFPSVFVDRLRATDQQVWQTAQTVEVEDTVPFDGERHTFLSVKFPLHTAQGELYAVGAIATDITERKHIEIELQCQRQFLRQIIDSIPALIFARDRSGRFTLINQTMAAINGATVEDLLGKTDADILSLTDAEIEQRQYEDDQVMATGIDLVIPERWVQDAQGQRNCFAITKRPLFATDTSVDQVLMVAMDITERKRAEDALHKSHAHLQAIFDNAAVGIFLISPDGGWLDMNHRGIQMFGYTLDELAQITYRDVLYPPRRTKHQNLLRKIRWDKQTSCRIEQRYLRKDGTIFWGDLSMTAIYDDQGNVHAILGVLVNITRSKEAEEALQHAMEQLRQQSIRDALTGLFNRRYLDETLPRELQRAMRQQQPVGLIMLDIDYFKRCNDTYGHAAGDTLLQAVGLFLQAHTRGEDIICRYGGEEFILVLPGAPLEATWKRAVEIRMGIKALAVSHQGMALAAVTVSLGVAVFPSHGETADSLIRAADQALYQAKRAGRDRVIVGAQTDNHLV